MKGKKWIGWLCIAAAAVCFILAATWELSNRKHTEQMEQIRETYTETKETGDPWLTRRIDFDGLKKINPDIVAWLTIPGTPVDHPVLKNPYDDHYLYRDYTGQYSYAGSVFIRQAVPEDFSGEHTILYGHNMRDGQMFGFLENYRDVGCFQSHPYIYVYLPGRETALKWQVYSAYECPDATITYRTVFENEEDYQGWLDMTLRLGNSAAALDPDDRVLTLSTCTASGGARLVVHSVLKNPEIT